MAGGRTRTNGAFIGLFAALAAAGFVSMAEINRIVAGVVVGDASYTTSALYGPLSRPGSLHQVLTQWSAATCTAGVPLQAWLVWHLGFDALFIIGYAGLGIVLLRSWQPKAIRLMAAVVAADIAEGVLALRAISALPHGERCHPTYGSHTALMWLMTSATTVKWLLVATTVVVIAFLLFDQYQASPGRFRDAFAAVKKQRFSVIVVAVLATLLLVPSGGVFDQSPDVARVWLLSSDHQVGVWHMAVATSAMTVLALMLRYLGSIRTARTTDEARRTAPEALPARPDPPTHDTDASRGDVSARSDGTASAVDAPSSSPVHDDAGAPLPRGLVARWSRCMKTWVADGWTALSAENDDRTGRRARSRWWAWLVVSAVLLIAAAALSAFGWATVAWRSMLAAGAIPVLVVVATFATGAVRLRGRRPNARNHAVEVTWQVGRVLAWSVLSIFGLGVLRAYVPSLVFGYHPWLSAAAVSGGLLLGCGIWLLAMTRRRSRYHRPSAGQQLWHPQGLGDPTVGTVRKSLTLPVAVAVALGLPMILWPSHLSRALGMIGVVALGLATLTAAFGALALAGQLVRPPRVFRVVAITTTPVITIVVAMALAASLVNSTPTVHRVRAGTAAGDAQQRWMTSSMPASIQEWLTSSPTPNPCSIPTNETIGGRPVSVRPMILVATEGGGAWAATWTVDILAALTTECARDSVFAASGVSGGSLGLAVMATSTNPKDTVAALGDETALSAATDGVLTRDLLAGSFGVNLNAVDGPHGDPRPDRAVLMEQAWERSDPGLREPFPLQVYKPGQNDPARARVPWHLIFNSTSALTGCRVTISDVDMRPAPHPDPEEANCYRNNAASSQPSNTAVLAADPIAGSYNLFAAAPCLIGMHTSTAALLSARFPYITPSGVVDRCGSASLADQLIDGGYSEDTGIATIDSLLSEIMPLVRDHNQRQLQAAADAVTLVQPTVVFLQKSARAPIRPAGQQPHSASEPLIPVTRGGGSGILGTDDTLLSQADALTKDSIAGGADAAAAGRAAAAVLPHRTMIVAPERDPQIAVPLGWALSDTSRDALQHSADSFLRCRDATSPRCAGSAPFVRLLSDLGVTPPESR